MKHRMVHRTAMNTGKTGLPDVERLRRIRRERGRLFVEERFMASKRCLFVELGLVACKDIRMVLLLFAVVVAVVVVVVSTALELKL